MSVLPVVVYHAVYKHVTMTTLLWLRTLKIEQEEEEFCTIVHIIVP